MHQIGCVAPVLIMGGCTGPLSTLDAAGPAAADIATLWWIMLAGGALLTALVLTLLFLSFHRRKQGRGSPRLWLFWLGVAMPTAVLLLLLGYALIVGERSIVRPAPGVVAVEAVAGQWRWAFGAAGEEATADILHIPVRTPVDVHISSTDVIHSFWVPRLGGKMDAIPGQVNILRIEAQRPGIYEGQCAEFCGLNHSGHRFQVIAHTAQDWAARRWEDQP